MRVASSSGPKFVDSFSDASLHYVSIGRITMAEREKIQGSRLDHLEELAEELIKENPEESVVKAHMKAAGLKYTGDQCERLEIVLVQLDEARKNRKQSNAKDLR